MAPLIVTPKLYAPVPPSIASAEYIVVTDTGRLIAALNTVGIVSFPHCSVQWGTGSCNTVRTLPLALSTFKVAFAMHQGTVTNTVIISSQDYASSLTQVKFLTNNSNDTAFVMYIIIGR